jgi:hypothetical protein
MARIGLTQLPRRLADHTGQTAPTYRRCFDYAVGNRFPAEFANSRWTVDDEPASLDVIAAALGMTAARPAAKSAGKAQTTPIAA